MPAEPAVAAPGSGNSAPTRGSSTFTSTSITISSCPLLVFHFLRSPRSAQFDDLLQQRARQIELVRARQFLLAVFPVQREFVVAGVETLAAADLVGGDHVDLLRQQFAARVFRDVLRFRREADQERPLLCAPSSARMSGFSIRSSFSGPSLFFNLWSATVFRSIVADRRRGKEDVALRRMPQHRLAHVARAAHVLAGDAGRRRQMHRTGDQLHVRAHLGGSLRNRETHAAGTAVADEAHRIDVLEGRAGADQNRVPLSARGPCKRDHRVDELIGFEQAARRRIRRTA